MKNATSFVRFQKIPPELCRVFVCFSHKRRLFVCAVIQRVNWAQPFPSSMSDPDTKQESRDKQRPF